MEGFAYVVARDYGFAPNPFYRICTLATCKQIIRKKAQIGDWIIGIGSKSQGRHDHLIYAMRVDEKLTFDQYWNDPRFFYKRPAMNGSIKAMYGDNIYHKDSAGNFQQENSHHSLAGGAVNLLNLEKDTGTSDAVLISHYFYYFGSVREKLPANVARIFDGWNRRGHKRLDESIVSKLISKLEKKYESGYCGDPTKFAGGFKRYSGKN